VRGALGLGDGGAGFGGKRKKVRSYKAERVKQLPVPRPSALPIHQFLSLLFQRGS
jgi:hypothetical protein